MFILLICFFFLSRELIIYVSNPVFSSLYTSQTATSLNTPTKSTLINETNNNKFRKMYRLSLILGASIVGLLSFVDLVEARLTNKNEGGLKDDEVGVSFFGTNTHRSRKNMPEIKIDGNVMDLMNNRNLRGGKSRGTKGGKGTKAGKRRKRASKASKHHNPNLFGVSLLCHLGERCSIYVLSSFVSDL